MEIELNFVQRKQMFSHCQLYDVMPCQVFYKYFLFSWFINVIVLNFCAQFQVITTLKFACFLTFLVMKLWSVLLSLMCAIAFENLNFSEYVNTDRFNGAFSNANVKGTKKCLLIFLDSLLNLSNNLKCRSFKTLF